MQLSRKNITLAFAEGVAYENMTILVGAPQKTRDSECKRSRRQTAAGARQYLPGHYQRRA